MAFKKGYIPWNKNKTGVKTSSKGYKHTKEARESMSKTRKAKGIFPPNRKGIPHTEEHKKKIGQSNKKAYSSIELRKQISDRQKGDLSHLWRGGRTKLRPTIRQSFQYRQWRSDIFTRDSFTCIWCLKKGGKLNADHYPKSFVSILIEYKIDTLEKAENCEELWNINNGRTLCYDCHLKTDNYGGKSRQNK